MPRDLGITPVPRELHSGSGFTADQSCGLFVGVRSYKDARFSEVPYAVDDAIDLAWTFSQVLRLIPPARVALAIAGEPQKKESVERLEALVGLGARMQPARLSEMYEELENLNRNVGKTGLLVLTVATHGFSDQGSDYLVFEDSVRRRVSQTGLRVDNLFDDIAMSPSERRIVILDACRERLSAETRSGGRDAESAMGAAFQAAIEKAKGQVVLCGSRLGGYSYDDHQRKNGVFSGAIMDGLCGEAQPDGRGFITPDSLTRFVGHRVEDWVARNRPEDAAKGAGIEVRVAGEAAQMPLALHREGHEKFKQLRVLAERGLRFLEEARAADREFITGALLDEVTSKLNQADCEPLVEQLQELEANTPARRRAFVAWFRSTYPAPNPSSSTGVPVSVAQSASSPGAAPKVAANAGSPPSGQALVNPEYVREVGKQSIELAQRAGGKLISKGIELGKQGLSEETGQKTGALLEQMMYRGMAAAAAVVCGGTLTLILSGLLKVSMAPDRLFLYQMPLWLIAADRLLFAKYLARFLPPNDRTFLVWAQSNSTRLLASGFFSTFLIATLLTVFLGIFSSPSSGHSGFSQFGPSYTRTASSIVVPLFLKWFFLAAAGVAVVMWKVLPREGELAPGLFATREQDNETPTSRPSAGAAPEAGPTAIQISRSHMLYALAARGRLAMVVSALFAASMAFGGLRAIADLLEEAIGRMPGLTAGYQPLLFLFALPPVVLLTDLVGRLLFRPPIGDEPTLALSIERWRGLAFHATCIAFLYATLIALPIINAYALVFPPDPSAEVAFWRMANWWMVATVATCAGVGILFTVVLPRGAAPTQLLKEDVDARSI